MSDMTPSEETAYGIIGMLGNDKRFKDRMDELTKARKAAEDAEAGAAAAASDLTKKRAETDTYVNGKKAELAVAQGKHDTAAKEVADRITLAKTTADEALKLQEQNKLAAAGLAAKEAALAQRERLLKDAQDGMAARLHEIEVGQDLVRRQQAHIAAMPKQ